MRTLFGDFPIGCSTCSRATSFCSSFSLCAQLVLLLIQGLDALVYHLVLTLLLGFQGVVLIQQLLISLLDFPTQTVGNIEIQAKKRC